MVFPGSDGYKGPVRVVEYANTKWRVLDGALHALSPNPDGSYGGLTEEDWVEVTDLWSAYSGEWEEVNRLAGELLAALNERLGTSFKLSDFPGR